MSRPATAHALHIKIFIGMAAGILTGSLLNQTGFSEMLIPWLKPIGTLFLRLITLVAVPLVLSTLIVGVASLRDISKLTRIGTKSFLIYILTTAFAVAIGLFIGNLFQPGTGLDPEISNRLKAEYSETVSEKIAASDINILDQLVNIVPLNPFHALSTKRGEMLQIVFFALLLGLALNRIPEENAAPVIHFFDGFSRAMIRIVEMVIQAAPVGVFALIAVVIADFGFEILTPLGAYFACVAGGLILHVAIVYLPMIHFFSRIPVRTFFQKMTEVQLLAFSSSSSAATLPVTMEVCQKKLGIREEVTGFVLPLGATINMDGTALYQGVAALFIAQVYGIPLDFSDQILILLTATLASIGTAAVPGVGMIMLIIVLESVHIPAEGIALIFGVDRILDMMRTTVNVTGDAMVASVVASGENLIDGTDQSGDTPHRQV